ncbi:hypothetical protein BDW72DRAFT_131861 [Aspergillus terricola var. indicus]
MDLDQMCAELATRTDENLINKALLRDTPLYADLETKAFRYGDGNTGEGCGAVLCAFVLSAARGQDDDDDNNDEDANYGEERKQIIDAVSLADWASRLEFFETYADNPRVLYGRRPWFGSTPEGVDRYSTWSNYQDATKVR